MRQNKGAAGFLFYDGDYSVRMKKEVSSYCYFFSFSSSSFPRSATGGERKKKEK